MTHSNDDHERNTHLKFKVNDLVKLTPEGISYYGGVPGWVPEGQGGGTNGFVVVARERVFMRGALPRPYIVQWANGVLNSYREEDLQLAETKKVALIEVSEKDKGLP